jgi:hypothetical protein
MNLQPLVEYAAEIIIENALGIVREALRLRTSLV